MNEPPVETGPAGALSAYVPRRITGPVVMGVVPNQPLAVAHRAAELAYSLNVRLICAYVDVTSYLEQEPDGRVEAHPIDPDGVDDDIEGISAGINERLRDALGGTGIPWSFVPSPGIRPVLRGGWRIRRMRASSSWAPANVDSERDSRNCSLAPSRSTSATASTGRSWSFHSPGTPDTNPSRASDGTSRPIGPTSLDG